MKLIKFDLVGLIAGLVYLFCAMSLALGVTFP